MGKIKAVIIGFAHMHVNEIVQYILAEEDFELVGFADIPPETAELTSARYTRCWNLKNNQEKCEVKTYDDYCVMLEELKPDYAFILCENSKKLEVVTECAKRGVNVSIEKPMATSLEEALKIRDVANQYNIEAIVNWPVIWRPYIHKQLAILNSGIVGDMLKCYYINGHTGPLGKGAKHRGVTEKAQEMTDTERASTWWYKQETGGGAFLDIGCYGCFFNQWVREQDDVPVAVMAFAGNYNTPYMNAPDNMAAIVEYKDTYAVLEGTWTMPQVALPTGPVYVCTDGVIQCTANRDVKVLDLYGEEIELPEYEIPSHIANIVDHVAHCKRTGTPYIKTITLDFNVQTMALIDAAMKSAESGKKELVVCTK